ncbi:hypothetical protein DMUE_3036 [Dictyocoela muelleri]|nr:hypothetical protein DMUE_3036 [Dictyocoela muelleri]
MKIEIIKLKQDKQKIIHNKYIYNIAHKGSDFISWRCIRRRCSGRIRTNFDINIILKENQHYHEEESERIFRYKLNAKINEQADNTSNKFNQVYEYALKDINKDEQGFLPNYNYVRDHFVKRKKKGEIYYKENNCKILDIFKRSKDNENFLQYESEHNDDYFLIFGSDTAVRTLQR